nr:choice-of-anchor M domain-containing protein [Jiangella ureilytica]
MSLSAASAVATDDPDLDQQIDPDQAIVTEQAVLSEGHVDIGPRYVDGQWTLLVHDDHAEPPVWRAMPNTVFQVTDASLTTVPDNPDYAFLPAEPGADVHVVPQAEQPGVVWVGWNTQYPSVMDTIDRGVTLTLRGVQGPGDVVVFLQSGTLGEPEVLWDSREAGPQDLWVEVNTHTHANWVFSEPGVYLVEVEVSADLVSGEAESDTQVIRFAVGDATSTDEALAAEYAQTADPSTPATAETPAVADDASESSGAGGVVMVGVGIAALLVIVLVTVLLRGRSAKKRAAAQRDAAAASLRGDQG